MTKNIRTDHFQKLIFYDEDKKAKPSIKLFVF